MSYPMVPGEGTLSDSLKGVFAILAIVAAILLAFQSWKSKKRK